MANVLDQRIDQNKSSETDRYTTFIIAGRLYGIDVIKVQEIVKPMPMTKVPLSPEFVKGLINLRGQVATAIGIKELFELDAGNTSDLMNVVCNYNGSLISFLVDEIGDVMEVMRSNFEPTPQTITGKIRSFMKGVYKESGTLLSVLDLESILNYVNQKES